MNKMNRKKRSRLSIKTFLLEAMLFNITFRPPMQNARATTQPATALPPITQFSNFPRQQK